MTLIQTCGAISLLCGLWNLYGDLYYLDFYTANLSMDEFAMVRPTMSKSGNIFSFDVANYNPLWLYVAQAGGWMYPIWAASTALPLYVGLRDAGWWYSTVPCVLMVYGLCVIGGSLHSAFAFLTVLPGVYHQDSSGIDKWEKLVASPAFASFLDTSQSRICQHIMVGCLPGYLAVNLASAWIAYAVATKSKQAKLFPKWLNAFSPFVTMAWISAASYLLPELWDFYLVGCMGTWGVLVLNIGVTYVLRSEKVELSSLFNSRYVKAD